MYTLGSFESKISTHENGRIGGGLTIQIYSSIISDRSIYEKSTTTVRSTLPPCCAQTYWTSYININNLRNRYPHILQAAFLTYLISNDIQVKH